MNKQPFYFDVGILFTATNPLTESEVDNLLNKLFNSKEAKKLGILKNSLQTNGFDYEAGDPSDLM
jgi:hypothetical protein